MKRDADSVFCELTRSICPSCRKVIDAKVLLRDNKVYMRKRCPECGPFEALVYADAEAYTSQGRYNKPGTIPLAFGSEVHAGCPYDCGLCPDHEQHACLGIIEVNSACNMNCPLCFSDARPGYSLTLEEVEEMLDIRIALELRALKLAIPNLTRESLDKARGILETYDRCDEPHQWRDLNLAFHLALYGPCDRPRLVKMIEDEQLANSHFLRTYVSITVGRDDAQAEHYEILAACAARDSRRALRLLETHIEHTRLALQRRRAAFPPPATPGALRK